MFVLFWLKYVYGYYMGWSNNYECIGLVIVRINCVVNFGGCVIWFG